jgi:hypothetical protein
MSRTDQTKLKSQTMRAAVPEFVRWNANSEFYWGRGAKFRAAFLPPPGLEPEWSAWSAEVRSTSAEKGVDPILRVSNAGLDHSVLFQRMLAPDWSDVEEKVEVQNEDLVRLGVTEFAGSPTPFSPYVRVIRGKVDPYFDNGRAQGRSFYINRDNVQTYAVTLDAQEEGLWTVPELVARLVSGFETIRVRGLNFAPVPGTSYLHCYLDSTTNYPAAGGGLGSANFRVYPYFNAVTSEAALPTWPQSNEFNRAGSLNTLLGFGPVHNSTPQFSGLEGQLAMWPPFFVN